ncbi:MAG TPA: RecQ family ATP-dependent DNA helicase [Microscillaceae bacterium]|nr:RecQ family ATP-dependent DNA helicase [Microscillaceae bacterium]
MSNATPNIHEVLKQYWGYDSFRPLQEDIILSVIAGHDTLALLPTGGGKSVCFQVPAMHMEGICIVISPLIALMKDQVAQLQKRDITATAIFSGMSAKEIDMTLEDAVNGKYKFIYVSPERLRTEIFIERVKRMKVGLLAIDEAHCISQWGYDFRPPYLQIAEFRQIIPEVTTIALTATATEKVKEDIQDKLAFGETKKVFQKSFARANLSYSTLYEENKERKLISILNRIEGSAVVYVRNRRRTRDIAEMIRKNGIRADFYHAGLSNEQRDYKQAAWIDNKIRVIVATNAFGMGIDKPDVRVVVHMDLPDSLEAYYQEAGRAGRDTEKAYAVALFDNNDIHNLEKKVAQAYPDTDIVKAVYQALANYYNLAVNSETYSSFDFDLGRFVKQFNLENMSTYYALKTLNHEGLIQFNESFYNPSKIFFKLRYSDLYEFLLKNPFLEPLVKLLLRMCGGEIFNNFVRVSENEVAKFLQISTQQVVKQLEQLQQYEVLEYQRQKTKPQVLFLTPRHDARKLPLDIETLEMRKQRDLEKVQAVIHYMKHKDRCRTQLLLEYFGEVSYDPCGVCDVCVKRQRQAEKQAGKEEDRFPEHSEQILTLLKEESLPMQTLVDKVDAHKDEILEVIQKMVDVQQIVYLDNGKMAINES